MLHQFFLFFCLPTALIDLEQQGYWLNPTRFFPSLCHYTVWSKKHVCLLTWPLQFSAAFCVSAMPQARIWMSAPHWVQTGCRPFSIHQFVFVLAQTKVVLPDFLYDSQALLNVLCCLPCCIGRAWLYLALSESSLESYLRLFQENQALLQKYYFKWVLSYVLHVDTWDA